jgi:hypothetical protein
MESRLLPSIVAGILRRLHCARGGRFSSPEKDPSSTSAGVLMTQTVAMSAAPSSTGSPTECASAVNVYRKPASPMIWGVAAEKPAAALRQAALVAWLNWGVQRSSSCRSLSYAG